MNKLDNLSYYNQALRIRELQLSLSASNIANQDTPNYKAKGVDFKTQMDNLAGGQSVALLKKSPRHFSGMGDYGGINIKYVNGGLVKADGNTVNEHFEKAQLINEKAMYEATLNLSKRSADSILNSMKFQ
ncbi:flagellar basal body rod protein FlgB [Photobacterium kishitanii]|uniref:Flagellar basal body rod protein FlgB n=1 Tax=Photobacterium kishitanii TaxID=318456 RepID=A0A2T3KMU5_9GAMM|nr:flagellar basal body rod protein FlgB [Photobacterium kishitanii]PSV01123.1 flagellar basal body rod protein FlgB [Photobacterium kishitanii]